MDNSASSRSPLIDNKSRAIDFRQGDDLREDALAALIRAGVEYNLGKLKSARKKG